MGVSWHFVSEIRKRYLVFFGHKIKEKSINAIYVRQKLMDVVEEAKNGRFIKYIIEWSDTSRIEDLVGKQKVEKNILSSNACNKHNA